MPETFFDDLTELVSREIRAARKAGDEERLLDMVVELAALLAVAIDARCNGNPTLISIALASIAETATEAGGFVGAIKAIIKEGVQR